MNVPPLLIVDHGERRSGLPELLRAQGCLVRLERLSEADYLVSAGFAIERKATDFADSLISGRLFDQLERLADAYPYAALLIEGDAWQGNLQLKTPMLTRLYHWISLRPNLSTLYSPTTRMTARLLAGLASAEQADPSALPPTPAPPVARTARTPADLLCAFPGVGPTNAHRLLARFGSVSAVASASNDALCETVGARRGTRLHELLNQEAQAQ